MIVTCVYVYVKPEAVKSFVNATVENHLGTVREPGNIRFDILQQSDDHCRFMFYEVFESEEAIISHKSTGHYLKWREIVKDYMAEPRQGVKYNIIEPNDRTQW